MSRAPAQDRLGRLLAVVPWVAAHDGPPVEEVCRRFGLTEKDLLADLELLFLCGVYPFTPDSLIEVDVADGRVWIRFADYFRRPLRLTAPEGLALVSAGSALLGVPGADPQGALGRALTKLETVLGGGADDAIEVELGPVAPAVLATVRRGAEQHRKVEIDYYSFGRDGHSTRVVQPWKVFNTSGQWYLSGWCERAEGERLFRVDRVSGARLALGTFDPPVAVHPPQAFGARPEDPRVVLDLAPRAHWVASQYPNEGVEARPGGILRVRLPVSQPAWLERLLLRAGTDATVVEGDPALRRRAAHRLLNRYLRTASPAS